jgi:hypothetical protein
VGTLRIETYFGTSDTDPELLDFTFTFVGGDVGNLTTIVLPNPFTTDNGDNLYIRFSGVQLRGGLQVSGPFIGQTVAGMVTRNHEGFMRDYVLQNGVAIDIQSDNPTGTAELDWLDDTGALKTRYEYDQAFDLMRISTTVETEYTGFLPDTIPLITFAQTDTNGASVPFIFGNRNPEGNVTAAQGSIYFSATGVDGTSAIYIKEVGTGSTGWVSKGTLSGPSVTTQNSLVSWDSTNGTLVASESNTTIIDNGTTNELFMRSPSASGSSRYALSDSSDVLKFEMEYLETTDTIEFLSTVDMTFGAGPSASTISFIGNDVEYSFESGGTDNSFTIDMTASPDTNPIMKLITGGTDGAAVDLHVGDQNPNTTVTGEPGAVYIRSDNEDSTIYIHADTVASVNNWVNLIAAGAGDVSGPGVSTDNGLATWNGTGGNDLNSLSLITATESVSVTVINIESGGVAGQASIALFDSSATEQFNLTYPESTDTIEFVSNATAGIDFIISEGNADFRFDEAVGSLDIEGVLSTDENSILSLTTSSTNGETVRFYIGDRNPEGLINANPGSIYYRIAGINSRIYQLESASAGNTGWVANQGDVDGPATSTDTAICRFDGTTGKIIQDSSQVILFQDAGNAYIQFDSPSASGAIGTIFRNNVGATVHSSLYIQSLDQYLVSDQTAAGLRYAMTNAGAEFFIQSTSNTDTDNVVRLQNSGLNGGTTRFYIGGRDPTGNVSAAPGSVYFRESAADSDIYIHRGASTNNTGWVDILETQGDVVGPSISDVNYIAVFDNTSGTLIGQRGNAYITESGTSTLLRLGSVTSTGSANIIFEDDVGTFGGAVGYTNSSDTLSVSSSNDLSLSATAGAISMTSSGDIEIATTSASAIILNTGPHADTIALVAFETNGSNGQVAQFHVGDRNPDSNVSAPGGHHYFRTDGTDSNIYIKKSAAVTTTEWYSVISTVPSTVTDRAIAFFDGTTGDIISDDSRILVSTGTDPQLTFRSPGATDGCEITFLNSSGSTRSRFFYNEADDDTVIDGLGSDGLTILSANTIDVAGTGFPDTRAMFRWVTSGTNGAETSFYIGSRNPEGNINADPGAVYFRADGASSDVYVHRAASSGTTGWVDLFETGVKTDLSTSVDNAMAIWDGTDASKITQDSLIRSASTASAGTLEIFSPSASGFAGITFENSLSTTVFNILYSETSDIVIIETAGTEDIRIDSGGNIDLITTSSNDVVVNNNILFQASASSSRISMEVPVANLTTEIELTNAAGDTVHGRLQYDDNVGEIYLQAVQSTDELHIQSDEQPVFIDVDVTDANPIVSLNNSQNGFRLFSRGVDPNATVTGNVRDIAVAGNGLNNVAMYIQRDGTPGTSWAQVDLLQKPFTTVNSTQTLNRSHNRVEAIPLADITLTLPTPAATSLAQGFEQEITKNISNTSVITIATPGFYGHSGNFVISKRGDTVRYYQDSSDNIITYTNRNVVGILERTGTSEQSIAGLTGAIIILNGWNNNFESYEGLIEADQANDQFTFADVENLSSGDLYEIDCILVYRHSNNSTVRWFATVDDTGIATNYSLTAETLSTSTNDEKTVNLKGRVRTGITGDTDIQLYFTLATGNTLWFKRGYWKMTKIEGR